MLKLLIVYGTTEGQTRKIAHFMATTARAACHHVHELDATAIPRGFRVGRFDAAIVGASVHERRHQSSVLDFVLESLPALRRIPTAFFSVSLEAALPGEAHQEEARRYIADFLAETGWQPAMTIPLAGALAFTKHDYLRRLAAGLLARDRAAPRQGASGHEFTDWEAARRFVGEFLRGSEERHALPRPGATAYRIPGGRPGHGEAVALSAAEPASRPAHP